MLEVSMLDLTRELPGLTFALFDPDLEVELEIEDDDDRALDEAFCEAWFRQGDAMSDGVIDDPFELAPSEVISLAA
ncbi:MAG: hypothetical protein JNL83_26340 [Myxococcales bacterium]|nr:hypothetical protein [Myxococcales bacterium]